MTCVRIFSERHACAGMFEDFDRGCGRCCECVGVTKPAVAMRIVAGLLHGRTFDDKKTQTTKVTRVVVHKVV